MKFSIITPTHSVKNIPFLIELYESINTQSHSNWEWILYLNGEVKESDIPPYIKLNEKVKVYKGNNANTNVGLIKQIAFSLGTGDILVEVDHDDLLIPICLEELKAAFRDPEIGFVYSDSITFRMNKGFMPHNPAHGWTYDTVRFRNQNCVVHHHFPPTSHSLSYIWYSPDHVRAWRTSVYKELGGHNPELSVCDDHELCIRTYLGTKMHHIPKPLYVYRITGDNTWLERNALIQKTTRSLFDTHVRALAEKDCVDKGLLKIDLGGGLFPYSDYKTVDIREHADYVGDLNDGIPLPDNSVGVMHAHHILEHLKDPQLSMAEIHRVLAPGGWAFIEVPSTDGRGAFQDPTHVSYWNENSFFYYTRQQQAQFIDNTTTRFQTYKLNTYFPDKFMRDNDISVVCACLVAVKDSSPRYPGLLNI
jgi:glycosyltransferase involved in cell wall biosynthesis